MEGIWRSMAALMRSRRALAKALALGVLGLVLRQLLPNPYVWLFSFLAWGLAFAFLGAAVSNNAGKTCCRVLLALFLALFAVEGWLSIHSDERPSLRRKASLREIQKDRNDPGLFEYLSNFQTDDPVLGFRPKPGKTRIASRVLYDEAIVYDVTYTSLESGWRVTPQFPGAETAVVFFGCSFTYGEGLDDEESIPYRAGQLLGDDFQTFNFGFHGYGAHQMLAQIENGQLDAIARKYKRIQAFFITIDGHELRCNGHSSWDKAGPWYAIEDGQLVYKGKFVDMPAQPSDPGLVFLRNCLIYRALRAPKSYNLDALRDLHVAILAKAGRLLHEQYGASLTVALWPGAPFADSLEQLRVATVDLAPLFPDYAAQTARYTIPHDGHPNAGAADAAAGLLADYVLNGQAAKKKADEQGSVSTP